MPTVIPFGESLKKAEHKEVQDGEVRKGDSVDEDLRLRWKLDLGIRGVNETLNQAEAVFRGNPKIKQIVYCLRLV